MPEFVHIKHLPLTNPEHFFGRDDELQWLDKCWTERVFVASIVAWGGVGKTSLVTKWLCAMRDAGWPGAERVFIWSFYGQGMLTAGSSDGFFAEALKAFGDADPTQGSPWDKGERLAKCVREKRTLLVLDGVEPMQYGPGEQEGRFKDPALQTLVQALAMGNNDKNGFLLITSRIRLRDVDGFAGAKVQAKDLAHLSEEAGAALLNARGAKGSDKELRAASKEYDGHALALTLLGTYIHKAQKGDIRRRDRIPPLQGKPAQRMMSIYEQWFEGRLDLAILRLLGFFDRPASEGEMGALRVSPFIAGLTDRLEGILESDWNEAVTTLRDVGLISRAIPEHDETLDAHPLVRQHFGAQLKRDNLDAYREGHRRLYTYLQTKAPPLPNTLAEMEPLYAAVVHGCLAGKNQEALDEVWSKRILRGEEHFSTKKLGAFGNEVAMLSAFFEAPWERLAPGLSEPAQGFVLNDAGFALRALGRLQEATGLLRLGLERYMTREDWKNAAIVGANLSELLQSRGALHEALDAARENVRLVDKSEDAFIRMGKRTTLAAVQHALGQRNAATALFEEAEPMQEAMQPQHPRLYSVQGFQYCDLLLDEGQEAEVRERAAKTLEWAKPRQLLLDIALDHLSLGRAILAGLQSGTGGELNEATSYTQQAVEGLRKAGRQDYLPLGLLARAALHIHTQAFTEARRDLDEAHGLAKRCGFRLHECDAQLGYARLAIAEGKATVAREHVGNARKIVEATGYHRRDRDIEQLQIDLDKLPPDVKPVIRPVEPIVSSSHPMSNQTVSTQETVDIGIVIALEEEFSEIMAMCGPYTPHKHANLTAYRFDRGSYRIVATLVGEMGESHATRVTERLIDHYHPHYVAVVGIAGGIHDDLRVGDVYVPPQAVQYMQDAKAVAKKGKASEFTISPGAPAYRADFAFIEAARNLKFEHTGIHSKFREDCAKDLRALVNETKCNELVAKDLIRSDVAVLVNGHVATGPVVGVATAFSAWIRSHDRNIKALEMESAAVLLSAHARLDAIRAFAIRGISDYGDERKKALDEIGGGALRKYAMRNAVRLLWALLDAEALPRNPL